MHKHVRPVAAEARLADRASMLFRGTALTRGSGVGVVTATGLSTELGRVSQLVQEAAPGSSPLEKKLARLSAQLVWAVLILTALIAVVGIVTGKDAFLMIEAAIALAVAAIPEGLPIVATLALARGMWRMARQNALIERLSAVETLGATTVILTDKTGTLTENRMTVRRLWVPSGEIELDGDTPNSRNSATTRSLRSCWRSPCCATRLRSTRARGGQRRSDGAGAVARRLARRAQARGAAAAQPGRAQARLRRFSKMMATVHRRGDKYLFAVKGAPEAVLAAAAKSLPKTAKRARYANARRLRRPHREFGHHGLRVIACAMKTAGQADAPPYQDLTFVGLIGLEDPARADVPHAIHACREAGIRVVMVTGDHGTRSWPSP